MHKLTCAFGAATLPVIGGPPMLGKMLGHYRIVEKIGQGGMGVVYLAHDERLDRNVAIKVLPPGMLTEESVKSRFKNEAMALAKLNHPNIATIHDFDMQSGVDFLVMELISGSTLDRKIANGPLSESETVYISLQVLGALGAAHRLGIIHRDLKPSNIIVGPDQHVKVLDFGLSRTLNNSKPESTKSIEDDQQTAGTLAYMAPEVLQGRSSDARTDIWSYGVLVYEISSGHRPFVGRTPFELSSAILNSDPESLPPHLSQGFRSIVSRCLLREPQRRYQNVGEVEAAFESLNSASRPHASPTRNMVLIVVAILALGILAGVLLKKYFVAAQRLPTEKQLAILPLSATSESPEMVAFGAGLDETLTTRLTGMTRSNNLQIIPSSEIRARGVRTLQDANQEFGVNLGLELAVRRSGDLVRVNYSLVDAKTHRQLRADTITAPASDPFTLEDRVSESIINSLQLELAPQDGRVNQDHGTAHGGAFTYYLQGLGSLQEVEKPESLDSAVAAFTQAIEADPKYGLAYAGLGEAYWQKYESGHDASYVERAKNACESAVKLQAFEAAGYVCLGTVFKGTGRYDLASAAFDKASEIDPTNDDAVVGSASVYQALGKTDKAEETYRRAIAMRPQYARNYGLLGVFFVTQGRYAEAAEMFSKVVSISPDSFRGYSNLGGTDLYQGHYPQAVADLEKSIAIRKTGDALSNLGTAYFHMREFDEAAKAFSEAIRLDENNYPLWGNLADAYYYGGHQPQAVAGYNRASELAAQQLRINPHDGSVLADLADYHSMLGDKDSSFAYIRQALQYSPRDPDVLFETAQIYNQFDDEKDAIRWLQRALDAGFPIAQLQDVPALDNLRAKSDFQNLLDSNKTKAHAENPKK
jgi:serine/threonine protein kinase/tetratricopeptide (TPR) repeat protein